MKRWAVIIMLFITSAGTFLPCCLLDDCCVDQAALSPNENEHKEEGTCSPFFACITCAGFVEITKPLQLTVLVFHKPIHEEIEFIFIPSNYIHSFWQPPRSC